MFMLILQPAKAWGELDATEEKQEDFLSRFVYPVVGILTLVAFISIFITRIEFDFEIALRLAIKVLVAAFGGFFLAAYLLNEICAGIFHREKDMRLCQRFVGYSSAFMALLIMAWFLIPEFFFLLIFILYTARIVWDGAVTYMHVDKDDQLKFTLWASAVIILTPILLYFLMGLFMPGFSEL